MAEPREPSSASDAVRHRPHEDVMAMLLGTLFVALGIAFYQEARIVTGSTAGFALLLDYVTGWGFGPVFFVVNLPFYWLAIRRMGWAFTLRTFLSVLLVSLFARLTPEWVGFTGLNPVYAAIVGGGLMGMGLLILFRHRAGLGGINILALYLQETHGFRAGYVQLGVDLAILLAAFFVLEVGQVLLSLLGALVLNLIVALNHRPGRYVGVS